MEQYVTYNGKEGSGVITTLTKGKQYKVIEDLGTSICIRNDRGQKKYYYRQYFTDAPSPAKAEQEGLRDHLWDFAMFLRGKIKEGYATNGEMKLAVDQFLESTTPPVKEAPQPYLQVIQNFTLSDIDSPTFTHTEDFRKHFDYIKKKLMEAIKESHPHTAGDFMSFVGKELKDKQQSSLSKEEDLIYRIVEQWGNAMCSMEEKIQWLKDYAAESRQQPAGESVVWVKASERMPDKSGAYFCKDIKNTRKKVCFYSPEKLIGGNSLFKTRPWDVEWLDESGLASSREREVAIGFLDWIRDETICDGAPKIFHKESKKRVTHEEALNLYLQSTHNK